MASRSWSTYMGYRGTMMYRPSSGHQWSVVLRRWHRHETTHGGLLQARWHSPQAQSTGPSVYRSRTMILASHVFSYLESVVSRTIYFSLEQSQDVTINAHELLVSMRIRTRMVLRLTCSSMNAHFWYPVHGFGRSFLPVDSNSSDKSLDHWQRCCAGGRCSYVPQRDHVKRQPSLRHIQL